MIASSFSEQKEIREVMIFLQSYGITTAYALKIYKAYGGNTINIIRENPYRLAEDITGIGFSKADQIARSLGVDPNSPYRAMAVSGIYFQASATDTYMQGRTAGR